MDANVWKAERGLIDRCSESLVVVANESIFGGGPYSVAGGRQQRMIGRREVFPATIKIGKPGPGRRAKNGHWHAGWVEPFLPKHITEPYHPGGNSACYMIQTAYLMGCDPIYLLGFTIQSGSPYFFGRTNPVTKRNSFYADIERPLTWLRWFESRYPGRVQLWPGWQGPIYDVFRVADDGG